MNPRERKRIQRERVIVKARKKSDQISSNCEVWAEHVAEELRVKMERWNQRKEEVNHLTWGKISQALVQGDIRAEAVRSSSQTTRIGGNQGWNSGKLVAFGAREKFAVPEKIYLKLQPWQGSRSDLDTHIVFDVQRYTIEITNVNLDAIKFSDNEATQTVCQAVLNLFKEAEKCC